MPFTIAHPSIVIPLYKKYKNYFSLTGLIAGSIIPDFEYFIHFSSSSFISHSIMGVFIFDLPASIILSLVFHACIKMPLVYNLPHAIRARVYNAVQPNWFRYLMSHYIIFLYSLFIGILLHLVWDTFSHRTGYFAVNSDFLKNYISIGNIKIYFFQIIWHVSTWVGCLYLFIVFKNLPASVNENEMTIRPAKKFWDNVLLAAGFFVVMRCNPIINPANLRDVAIIFTGAAFFSIFIVSFYYTIKNAAD